MSVVYINVEEEIQMNEESLDSIIQQCRQGNRAAFESLVREYQGMVFSLALKMLADEHDAEDAFQDTFVSAWQNIGSFDMAKGKFSTWLYTIVSRICLDKLRWRRHSVVTVDDEQAFRQYVANPSPERQLMNAEWVAIVKVLVGNLSPKQRLVFTLRVMENVEMDDVVEITGMSREKIKASLYVARKQIREQLIRLGYDEE